ncbi:MAG TPA: GIY-YIG nuclease family protein, partial [Gammaproteobacteria bacterium]|nr:GIY-YIG nuclease family protein [Gammaproteobacteria bacterium]
GVTTDVARRVSEHQSGGRLAARYTRSRGSVILAYSVAVGEKSLAMRVEYRLRKLPATVKRNVIAKKMRLQKLLGLLDLQGDES